MTVQEFDMLYIFHITYTGEDIFDSISNYNTGTKHIYVKFTFPPPGKSEMFTCVVRFGAL
jgi:hypothetical protein